MTHPIANAVKTMTGRVSKSAGTDVTKSVERVTRQLAHGTEQVVKHTTESEAKHVEHLRSIHAPKDGTKKPRKPRKPRPPRPRTGDEALDKLNRSRRPAIRKHNQFQIFKNSKRAANGEDFICPNSGKTIPCERDANGKAVRYNEHGKRVREGEEGYDKAFTRPKPNKKGEAHNYNFGHVQGSEFWRLKKVVADHPNQFTWSEVRDEYDRSHHYQVEDPDTNQAHGSEDKTPGYGHYGGLHDRLKRNHSATVDTGTPDTMGAAGSAPKRRRR